MKFPGYVPQRDIDGADGGHYRTLAPVVARHVIHPMPEDFDIERIGADEQRFQRLVDRRRRDLRRLESLGESLAPAGEALVRDDFQQGGRTLFYPALRKCEWFA